MYLHVTAQVIVTKWIFSSLRELEVSYVSCYVFRHLYYVKTFFMPQHTGESGQSRTDKGANRRRRGDSWMAFHELTVLLTWFLLSFRQAEYVSTLSLKQSGCVLCDVKEEKSCLLGVKGHQLESGAAAAKYLTIFFVAALRVEPGGELRAFPRLLFIFVDFNAMCMAYIYVFAFLLVFVFFIFAMYIIYICG